MDAQQVRRLESLDAFRGMTIAAMILVIAPGDWDHVYRALAHAEWEGCTPADLVFPIFLLIAGVAMWFSLQAHEPASNLSLLGRIVRRSLLIYLVGLFISQFPDFLQPVWKWQFMGVLQRIALSYLVAALACAFLPTRRLWLVAAILLLGYWALVVAMGGDDPYSRDTVFGRGMEFAFFISTVTSVVPIVLGYLVGDYLGRSGIAPRTLAVLAILGVVGIGIGGLWGLEFPIIKSVFWSSSYVVYAVGFGLVVLAASIWTMEIAGIRAWARPFVALGRNPLVIYAIAIVLDQITWTVELDRDGEPLALHSWLNDSFFAPVLGQYPGSLAYALVFLLLLWSLAWWMDRRKLVIRA